MIFEGRTGERVHCGGDGNDDRMVMGKRWAWDWNVGKGVRRGFTDRENHPWKSAEVLKLLRA